MTAIESVTVYGSNAKFQPTPFVTSSVDIYTFEQGLFTFKDNAVLSLKTSKFIKKPYGEFEIHLAPETLTGNLSWSQIITPMSFVVIGLQRGGIADIPMVGIVRQVSETQTWTTDSAVRRVVLIRGADLGYFFNITDYYTLWYLAANQKAALGITADGLLSGDPGYIGSTWYNKIMAGKGVYANTYFPYKGSQITFPAAFGQRFDLYDVIIPYGDYFLGGNESWYEKFMQVFPFPFYEFFVTTMANGVYENTTGGTAFSATGLSSTRTATPVVVARLNPVPQLVASTVSNVPNFIGIDSSAWQGLPAFDLQGSSPVISNAMFNESEVHNFYTINPLWLSGQNGQSNSNLAQFIFNYAVVVDDASINRYGYRPMMGNISWFADVAGGFAQSGKVNLTQVMSTILARFCGYYEATPLMATAGVQTWLRPDIQIGCKFSYAPFKDGALWDFYIEGVEHTYTFGGPSKTVLSLTRGLPKTVYAANQANGLLFNIHQGNAQRINGAYQSGLPAGSAAYLHALAPTQFATWQGQLNHIYITPQAVGP